MKRFLVKTLIIVLPFLLIFSPFLYLGWQADELRDFDWVVEKQREADSEYLIGMAYNEQTHYLKLSNVNHYKPTVLAVGSSRTMPFRAIQFSAPFYNAGGVTSYPNDFINFLRNIDKEALPEVLIIGLDSYFFNDFWNGTMLPQDTPIVKRENGKGNILSLIMSFLDGTIDIGDLLSNKNNASGFNAICKGDGYLKDGSYYYGKTAHAPEESADYQFTDTYIRIEKGERRFEYAQEVDVSVMDYIIEVLDFCKDNDVQLIAFIPPYAPSVVDKMKASGDYYAYLEKIAPMCAPVFAEYGFEFYDYTDIRHTGADDSYFTDGFHASGVGYGLMLEDMISRGSILSEYTDIAQLRRVYEERYSNLVYELLPF